jgi:hypothetical protein
MLFTHSFVLFALVTTSTSAPTWQEDDARALARRIPLPELRQEELPRWRELVRPTADELAYQSIPWIPSFAQGVQRASAEGKPLLFWAMNGHPLGCT